MAKPPLLENRRIGALARLAYAANFIGARDDIVRQNYKCADRRVEMLFRLYKASAPSTDAPIMADIMCGLVAWNLRDFDLTYLACRAALDGINASLARVQTPKVRNELHYLRGYCKNLVAFADADGGVNLRVDFSDINALRTPEYDLALVRGLVKRTFPLVDTDWWRSGAQEASEDS